jgi:RNA polymerase sigma-70 factor (ECF subfamily)
MTHEPAPADSGPNSRLNEISTRWAILKDPVQFLLRYGPAIRKYLQALLKNPDDVEEISQDILLRVVQEGFGRASPDKGRFRDYLKTAVRNAALNHLRRKHAVQPGDAMLQQVPDRDEPCSETDQAWLADWQRCVLGKAWRALDTHERKSAGNLFHTVLRLSVDHPEEDSVQQAERTSQIVGRTVRPEAFRKQLSRARRMFAEVLADEVSDTLENPTRERVEEELIDLGLMPFVRDYLPADWRPSGS